MHTRSLYLIVLLCLALIISAVLPGVSAASQEKEAAALEELYERKAALDAERTQLEEEFLEIIHRGKTQRLKSAIERVDADLKSHAERLALYLERRSAFEKDWYNCHPWLKDSPELESFKTRKASLDSERTELLERYSELVGKTRPQVSRKRKIRYFKIDLREIEEQFLTYRNNRDAFEKDWGAFCAVQRSVK